MSALGHHCGCRDAFEKNSINYHPKYESRCVTFSHASYLIVVKTHTETPGHLHAGIYIFIFIHLVASFEV